MPTRSSKTIMLATNLQRSVLTALDENQTQPIAYAAYGFYPRGNSLPSLLGFNGEPPDPMTGHYHLGRGYRQYNPVLMRFNSADSQSPFRNGGINAYVYCEGDPVNHTDPSGHLKVMSLFLKMIKNAKTHHKAQQPHQMSKSTLFAMEDTAAALGGEKMVSKLAKKEKTSSKTFLLERTIQNRQEKTIEIFAQKKPPRSIEDTKAIIAHLSENNDIYFDILIGTRKGKFRPENIKKIHEENEMHLGSMNDDLQRKQRSTRKNQ